MTHVLTSEQHDQLLLFLADAISIPPVLPDDEELVDDEGVPLARTDPIGAVSATPAGRAAAEQIRAARREGVNQVWANRPIGRQELSELAAASPTGVQLLVPTRPGSEWSSTARRHVAEAAAASLHAQGVPVVWIDLLPLPVDMDDAETEEALRRLGRTPTPVGRAEVSRAEVSHAELASYDSHVLAAVARHRRPPNEQGLVLFFTGLSGSGKSTIAAAVAQHLTADRTVTLLDGDRVRRLLSSGLGFNRADRDTNITRIGYVAAEIARHGGVAVCAPIAPYERTRTAVRSMVAEADATFVLVHVATPLAECERRDRKGLYAKARAGEIPEFTGISDPYEAPTDADLVIDTTDRPVGDCVDDVLAFVRPLITDSAD